MNRHTEHHLLHQVEQREAEAGALRRQREADANLKREEAVVLRQQQAAASERAQAAMLSEERRTLLKVSQFIWLGFGVVEGLIGLRLLLKLMAANPNNPFAILVYSISDLFVWPFMGLTVTPAANGVVLEISSIIALFFYVLVSILVERMIWIIFSRPKV
jgi:YggT family protein